MLYLDVYKLRYQNNSLTHRTIVAVNVSAQKILVEPVNTPNHAQRLVWAKSALLDARQAADRMMWGLVSDPTVQSAGESITDAQLQVIVDSLVNTFSGV